MHLPYFHIMDTIDSVCTMSFFTNFNKFMHVRNEMEDVSVLFKDNTFINGFHVNLFSSTATSRRKLLENHCMQRMIQIVV